ncbi:MAG: HAD family hydrolase [Rhodospirillaceae bacterium]|nr:HAD family hydrolase [Rhodospirillales bacterium]MBT3906032.1 HAD family hydrolase [Rhodospirillaceae bacterium]MBT4699920.1 HAD family hydrolase [Rhodospirillaceae bacterium]MBT5036051.1 HAD family hydrolase [Rhodospirillaceae bacterium]MBT6220565.1 HAD family hydrolase [Rhodospirillaceae bacterium]
MKPCSALPPGAEIDPLGTWCQIIRYQPQGSAAQPALFLDRDGVVVEEVHYLHRVEDTIIVPGAADVIRQANERGILVVIVTNQAGVGRGIYTWDDFITVQDHILDELSAAGARVDAVYACPHHTQAGPPYNDPDAPDRKPNPGMLLRAADAFEIEMRQSWIIGDRANDLVAGLRAGINGGIHVFMGHGVESGEREQALALNSKNFSAHGADSIADALKIIPLLSG